MATFQRLTLAALFLLPAAAANAYVFPSPPPGFGGTPGNWTFTRPTGSQIIGSVIRQSKGLSVPLGPAGSASLTVAYKIGPTFAKAAALALYTNPYLRGGAAFAAWLYTAKVIWDEASQRFVSQSPSGSERVEWDPEKGEFKQLPSDGSGCVIPQSLNDQFGGGTAGFIETMHGYSERDCDVTIRWPNYKPPSYPYGVQRRDRIGRETATESRPLTKEDLERELVPEIWKPGSPSIIPPGVPAEMPEDFPFPVGDPVVNPSPDITNPQPMPYFVPTGDPVSNPTYNPDAPVSPTNQPFIIPGIRIVPSPTPQDPYRVDVQPVDRPTTSPVPLPPEQLNPQPDPATNPEDQPKDQPKPEEQQSLCEKHPDILACQKLDEVKEEPLGKEEIQIRINPLGGWGPDSAQCPAPMSANVMGHTVELSWQPVCAFADGLRPIVIALAWLSAASMLVVVARRN